MNKNIRIWILLLILTLSALTGSVSATAETDVPVELTITVDPELKLEGAGIVDTITFTLSNTSDDSYTLYNAKLSGGYDGEERALNEIITIDAHSTREFSLSEIPVTDEQLDKEIIYVLAWDELVPDAVQKNETDAIDGTENDADASEKPETEADAFDVSNASEDENALESPASSSEQNPTYRRRILEASVKIDRFVTPELSVSVSVSQTAASAGDTISATYFIINDTKYDMTGISLTDKDVYEGSIPLPSTELMAGASITVPVEYTVSDIDLVFHPVVSFVAAQRQSESEAKETVTVESVVTGIRIDVEQYPSNEEGSTFAITVTNTGNRPLKNLQVYDEINTQIDKSFDLGPGQQKILMFNVPSAYSSGLVRNVRFRVTGKDYFNDTFSYTDVNSYECLPYVASDAVRLSVHADLKNAFYDENGKLCGEILIEIRNYSDVRIINAVLSETTLFGALENYAELQRGESYHTAVFQLDNIESLSFQLKASDQTGKTYYADSDPLNLDQLASFAASSTGQTVIQHSNTFLKTLSEKVFAIARHTALIILALILISSVLCLVLWFFESMMKSKIPKDSLLSIVVPKSASESKQETVDPLAGSPAEQLGYTAPAKLRYGSAAIHATSNPDNSYRISVTKRSAQEKKTMGEDMRSASSSKSDARRFDKHRPPAPTLFDFMNQKKEKKTEEVHEDLGLFMLEKEAFSLQSTAHDEDHKNDSSEAESQKTADPVFREEESETQVLSPDAEETSTAQEDDALITNFKNEEELPIDENLLSVSAETEDVVLLAQSQDNGIVSRLPEQGIVISEFLNAPDGGAEVPVSQEAPITAAADADSGQDPLESDTMHRTIEIEEFQLPKHRKADYSKTIIRISREETV